MKLRETWVPNEYQIPACIWCKMPAARCVIEEPCEDRKWWEYANLRHITSYPTGN